MGMPQLATNWDREQVLALPEDGQRHELVDGRRPRAWAEVRTPLLVIEVLSPSTARHDRLVKRSFYQRQGVPEYWIVDLDASLVERWRPADARPEILTDRLEWQPDPGGEPMVIDLAALFAEIGEE